MCIVNLFSVKSIKMYTLMHGFYKYLVQKDEYCVLILGLDDAGKTVSATQITNSLNIFRL